MRKKPSGGAASKAGYTINIVSMIFFHKYFVDRTALPLIGICCLVCVGLGIAITIVLALIPLYLPVKDATLGNTTSISKCILSKIRPYVYMYISRQ